MTRKQENVDEDTSLSKDDIRGFFGATGKKQEESCSLRADYETERTRIQEEDKAREKRRGRDLAVALEIKKRERG